MTMVSLQDEFTAASSLPDRARGMHLALEDTTPERLMMIDTETLLLHHMNASAEAFYASLIGVPGTMEDRCILVYRIHTELLRRLPEGT